MLRRLFESFMAPSRYIWAFSLFPAIAKLFGADVRMDIGGVRTRPRMQS